MKVAIFLHFTINQKNCELFFINNKKLHLEKKIIEL
jgi:hypothetical protein